jgi:Heliorhodopsin
MSSEEDLKFRKLRNFNAEMGVLHLLQGILMLALSNSFSLPVQETLLRYDPVSQTINPITNTLINLQIGPMVAMFLFISAIAHFSLSTFAYDWYVSNLKKGINYARWYEYAFSSSIMIVVIAMLCGIYELSSLILIFSLNATMNLFGLMMEKHNQTTAKTDWTAFIFGCFAGLMPWIVLGTYFFGAALSSSGSIPNFVIFIFVSLAIFFNIFAVNMVLQYKKVRKWKDYLYGERFYIILSLVAKSLLAWQVFAGTLRGA